MVTLEQFRQNANKHNVCEKYAALWDAAGSKKELMDIALCSQGADFLCDAYAKGWGVSKDEIKSKFDKYINGKYVYKNETGYTSKLYCDYYGTMDADTTLLVLLDCDALITVPDYMVCTVLAAGKNNITIFGGRSITIEVYGNPADTTVENTSSKCRIRKVYKKAKEK